jgi:hypothetical protein
MRRRYVPKGRHFATASPSGFVWRRLARDFGDGDVEFAGVGLRELPGHHEDRERPGSIAIHYGGKLKSRG